MKTKLLRRLRKNLKIIARDTIEDQIPKTHYTLINSFKYITSSFDFKYVLSKYLKELEKILDSYKVNLKRKQRKKENVYQILP